MTVMFEVDDIKHFEKAGNFLSCCRVIRGGRYSGIVCNDMTIFNCFFVGNLKPLWCKYDLYYLELKLKYQLLFLQCSSLFHDIGDKTEGPNKLLLIKIIKIF